MSAACPSLKGRPVVVTGGGSGIGAAVVEAFVAQGAKVAFIDIIEDESQALADRLAGAAPRVYSWDLTDAAAIKTIFARIAKEVGAVECSS